MLQPITPTTWIASTRASILASIHVLVRHNDLWRLVAGHNTPINDVLPNVSAD